MDALTREFLADFCNKSFLFRPVDYRDAVDDKNVVQGIVILDLISTNRSDSVAYLGVFGTTLLRYLYSRYHRRTDLKYQTFSVLSGDPKKIGGKYFCDA